jgi:glutamine synthetase
MSELIEYVELRFVDVLGRLKAMTVPCKPAKSLEELANDPILEEGTSLDGSSVPGLADVEHSDLRLEPDLSTLIELPFRSQRVAAVMCFIKGKVEPRGGKPHPRDSRGILHAVCDKFLGKKYRLDLKIEHEFHFMTDEGLPFDQAGYAETYPASRGADILLELATTARRSGMEARVIHHENGQAQQEIEIDYEDVLSVADETILFKNLARTVARKNGIAVSFMPKPYEGAAGNGLHCHVRLWEADQNLFGQSGKELSETAKHFVAGLLEQAPAITAIANSTVNSYKRLVPHHEAPVYITWGYMNRTVLVRVPLFNTPGKAAVEFRSADPMANPYLLFAALIACGFDGVARRLTAPEPRKEDIYKLTDRERQDLGIETLPSTLYDALDELEASKVIRKALGDELLEAFISLKRREWREYANEAVTDWERKAYQYL